MGENSKKHVMEMMQSGDQSHKDAVESMMKLSKEDQSKWHDEFMKKFESLPEA